MPDGEAAIPVFVGSTYLDLRPYRDAVREALHRLGVLARGMEYFGATANAPKDECLSVVRSCSAYVGIFGMRYGSLDPSTGKSMTHLEYEQAQHIRLPSLIYLVDEDSQPVLPRFVDTGDSAERLAALKGELLTKFTVSFFTTPEDLARRISQDLPRLIQWIRRRPRSSELERIVRSIPRIDWLDDDLYAGIRDQIPFATRLVPADSVLREAVEFILSGDRQAAAVLIFRATGLDFRASIDLCVDIQKTVDRLLERGAEIVEESKSDARSRDVD